MFKEFIESKGLICTEIPNIYNEGLSTSSHLYNWDLRFNVDDVQVIINCDSETIRYIDHRKEVKTSKEKRAFKNLMLEFAGISNFKYIK